MSVPILSLWQPFASSLYGEYIGFYGFKFLDTQTYFKQMVYRISIKYQ